VGSLAAVLSGAMPALDANSRPTAFYTREPIHERCPREEREEASRFGQDGFCMKDLGCKGPTTHADCDLRQWNNKQNWCIGVNGLCIGCTEPDFPAFPLHKGGESGDDDGVPITPPLPYKVFLPFVSNGGQ
jgi:hydrogenase small subunit